MGAIEGAPRPSRSRVAISVRSTGRSAPRGSGRGDRGDDLQSRPRGLRAGLRGVWRRGCYGRSARRCWGCWQHSPAFFGSAVALTAIADWLAPSIATVLHAVAEDLVRGYRRLLRLYYQVQRWWWFYRALRRRRVDVQERGDELKMNCPVCGDQHGRLFFNTVLQKGYCQNECGGFSRGDIL